jgi:PEP-CTERM motif
MRHAAHTLAVLVAALVLGPGSKAEADPIRVTYRVDVTDRCTFANNAEVCRAFDASFPLTLSFDGTIVESHSTDGDLLVFYGSPTLSNVPPQLRDDFPPFDQPGRLAGDRERFELDLNGWVREADVTIRQFARVNGSDYTRGYFLYANETFASAPALNAQSFVRFLGTAAFRRFSVSDAVERADGGFELLSYSGQLSLESTAATPEPSSFLLVAGGALSLVWRRRRDRHRAFRPPGGGYGKTRARRM